MPVIAMIGVSAVETDKPVVFGFVPAEKERPIGV